MESSIGYLEQSEKFVEPLTFPAEDKKVPSFPSVSMLEE